MPDLPDKGDVSDWLDADPTRNIAELVCECLKAPLWEDRPVQCAPKEDDEREANQAPIAAELPTIQIHPRISVLTTETQAVLLKAEVPFYQRRGELVRPIVRTVEAAHGHLTRSAQLKTITAIVGPVWRAGRASSVNPRSRSNLSGRLRQHLSSC